MKNKTDDLGMRQMPMTKVQRLDEKAKYDIRWLNERADGIDSGRRPTSETDWNKFSDALKTIARSYDEVRAAMLGNHCAEEFSILLRQLHDAEMMASYPPRIIPARLHEADEPGESLKDGGFKPIKMERQNILNTTHNIGGNPPGDIPLNCVHNRHADDPEPEQLEKEHRESEQTS